MDNTAVYRLSVCLVSLLEDENENEMNYACLRCV